MKLGSYCRIVQQLTVDRRRSGRYIGAVPPQKNPHGSAVVCKRPLVPLICRQVRPKQ